MARERKTGPWSREEQELLKKYKPFYQDALMAGAVDEFFQAFMIIWFHHFPESDRLSGTPEADEIHLDTAFLTHCENIRS
jgi:hypothetical protein